MADYLPLISRAIANLPEDSPEARRAIYERASAALQQQLRSLEPPLSEADIARERLALDAAIARIEADRATSERTLAISDALPDELSQQIRNDEAIAAPAPDPETQESAAAPIAPLRPHPPRDKPRHGSPAGAERPRLDTSGPRPDRSRQKRGVILVAVLALVIAGIAALAIYLPKTKVDLAGQQAAQATGPVAGAERKFNDRVGGSPAPAAQSQGTQGQPPQQQAAQGQAAQGQAAPGQASSGQAAPQGRPAGVPAQPEIAVAQRAILYEENQQTPQVPNAIAGRVVWRIESVPAGQGQLTETAIRGDVDLPEAGLQLAFTLRRNTDATLPASHLLQLTFTNAPNATEARQVRDVGVPQMKTEENARGAPLAGLPVPVTQNVFLIGLSSIRADAERNVELLRSRPWIDLPVRFADGHRGVIALEKGSAGERAFRDAFSVWQP